MPIYEFKCHDCGHKFEDLVSMNAELPACPECKSTKTGKLLSTFAASVSGASPSCASAPSCPARGGFG